MNKQIFVLLKFAIFTISVTTIYSCSSSTYIKTKYLDIKLSDEGKIVGMWIGKDKIEKKIVSFTEIEGCRVIGKVKIHKTNEGIVEFERTLINDSLYTKCTIVDRFTPTKNSIRWDVEIRGNDRAWSAPIKTVFNYPASKETRFWTTWGRPIYDSSADNSIREALKPVPGGSPEAAILDKSNKDWVDPLIPVPFITDTLFYGAPPPFEYNRPLWSAQWTFLRELFSVPIFTILENKEKIGINLALSPEDNILDLVMTSTPGGSVVYSRLSNRISSYHAVKFSMDLIGNTDDWRCGLGWMSNRYPDYFNPKNPNALKLNGTAAYSNSYADFDVKKMKDMDFTVKTGYDFPYMGMFLPPVKPTVKWKRFVGGELSIKAMNDYAGNMKQKGFYVLNYFNVTEFGTNVKYPYTPKKNNTDTDLWKESNDFLFNRLSGAILQFRTGFYPGTKNGNPFYTWGNGVAMDCADSAYREFLLDQARRHINEIPNSSGIYIDRLDWLNVFNVNADDSITWFDGRPARSIITSYKALMEQLGPIMHDAGKYILANGIGRRIDYFKHLDGSFDEMAYGGTPLNTSAFICINKAALAWTDRTSTVLKEGGDNFFQKYLYMGVFPMCPFPENDHSIRPSDSVDRIYLDYGPLMKLMRERKWVLSPHVVSVKNNAAKANIFSTPDGYLIPVVYGKQQKIQVSILLPVIPEKFKCLVYYPGIEKPVEIAYMKEKDKIIVDMDLVRGCGMLLLKTTKL